MRASPERRIDLVRLAPSIGETCDEYLNAYRAQLQSALVSGQPGTAVSRQYARSLDGLLGALGCAALAAGHWADGRSPRVALAAVGGYARGVVGLHSDVDVLFICEEPGDPRVTAIAEGLLYPLWDLGLQIGHAVRGVNETIELARTDIRTATTLLDLRLVSGDRDLVSVLRERGRREVFEPELDAFLDALIEDTQARHERYGDSLFLLEPEVKLGRGGLRDLDVAAWAAQARWGCETNEDYVRQGALLERELKELDDAREMLWRVRNHLHRRAARKQDRLTFADQEDIADAMGFVDGVTLAVEQFMQAYYRHARTVAQTSERLLDRARRSKTAASGNEVDLGGGIVCRGERLALQRPGELSADPEVALRLYDGVRRHAQVADTVARDHVARAASNADWAEKLRATPEASELFLRALTSTARVPVRRGSLIGELHEVGLLVALIPEFGPVTGRVQHDDYHVYTVDIHAVRAVDELAAFVRGDRLRVVPLACRLAAEAPRRTPLFLAVLLHDLAKAYGIPASEAAWEEQRVRGAQIARDVAGRLGLVAADVEHVGWLVHERLRLYTWATRRDTSDPEAIREIAQRVGTLERLRDLYLLTASVVASTNPNAMTAWKARMLEDVYLATAAHLDGSDPNTTVAGRVQALRQEVQAGWIGDAQEDDLRAFLGGMPDRYVLSNPVDMIRYHARAVLERGDSSLHVGLVPGPTEDLAELIVVSGDRRGLLADVALVLASHRLSVVQAQIYTRRRADGTAEAVDLFQVKRAGRVVEPVDAASLTKLRLDLEDLVSGRVSEDEMRRNMPKTPAWAQRRSPDVDTEVVVDNAVSSRFTVIDVFTRDRLGLLHFVSKTLRENGLSIALSKISTEGARATDVFYVERDPSSSVVRDFAELPSILESALLHFQQQAEQEE